MNESRHPFQLNAVFRFCGYFFGIITFICLFALIRGVSDESMYGFLGAIAFMLLVVTLFFHLGKSEIRLTETSFILMLVTKKVIAYSDIKKLSLVEGKMGNVSSPTSTIPFLALVIEYGQNKKLNVNVHFYGKPEEILKTLECKTGKTFEMTDAAKGQLKRLKIKL